MSDKSAIEWTDATWNPTRGCDKVSPGCKHCYAETFAERFRGVPGHPYEQGFDFRLAPDKLEDPLHWKKPRKVFVNSMSDLFHKDVPDNYIAAVFGVMAACPQHTFQILTKRAERLPQWFRWLSIKAADCRSDGEVRICLHRFDGLAHRAQHVEYPPWPLPNVWIGVSVEDQERADERIPHLLRTPATIRFLSCEPLLGPVDLGPWFGTADFDKTPLHWVIVGGESGTDARSMEIPWASSLVDQCRTANVATFVKQWGSLPIGKNGQLVKLRSKKGGDPSEWSGDWPRQFPEVRR